jgi:hypothetical protein
MDLFGIQRKIAYAKRKYHSGLICVGVTIGLDIIQLSASININGKLKVKNIKTKNIKIKVTVSLSKNIG